ncbi:heme biosynthesis protein HemY [Ehrlichia ruminantium]|uniref:Heme biosynthesis protein HemY n=1 Tax=Ehrlichia ruminantium TaxID=779 RepID=A0AAE6Q9N8_EHRRU|nr:heme biosynthesis HemY N-terminal domain-containing protein [Ehrlichia ruminantium]QGR02173.1 heme biosynthesis protein HemY [Ehrlichia ruminantium]QGR03094.1 heme biosynthesis protein HemY [Ehrlichia ruminantium]QGR04019.1 heme biosynthesis protein HemY [Ehrlichia ruminantium]
MITSVLIFFIIALTIGLWAIDCDGVVKIEWLHYNIEINILFALCIIAIIFLCIILLVRLVFYIFQCFYSYKKHQQEKRIMLLDQGYMYLNCGNIEKADKCITKLHKFNHPSLFLLKGRFYFDNNKYALAEKYFTQFTQVVPIIDPALGIHLLNHINRIEDQSYQLTLFRKMLEVFYKQSWSAIFKLEICRISRDWNTAIEEMHKIIKLKINVPYDTQEMLCIFYYALAKQHYTYQKYDDALQVLDNIKHYSKYRIPIILLKAQLCVSTNKQRKAIQLLESEYRTNPHPDIANFYLEVMHHDSQAIHKLYNINNDYYFSTYLIAQDAINLGEYNIAMKYLNNVFNSKTYISLRFLMIKLKVLLQDHTELLYWTDKTMKDAIVDQYWQCKQCKCVPINWNYECDNCKGFNTIVWV